MHKKYLKILFDSFFIKIINLYLKMNPYYPALIALTYRCQCHCVHCGIAGYTKKGLELNTKEVFNLLDQLRYFKRVREIFFIGGESLLRNDLFELIEYAKRKGFKTRLDTNGYLLDEETISRLKMAGLDQIWVSLDSAEPKIHNNLRSLEEVFEKAVEGIRACVKQGVHCCISIYASKENLRNGELEKTLSFARDLNVNRICILPALAIGNWLKEAEKIKLDSEDIRKLKSICVPRFISFVNNFCSTKYKKLLYISPYGDVQPCIYIPYSFGNIRTESIYEIVKRMWSHPIFNLPSDDKGCLVMAREFRQNYIEKINPRQDLPIKL